MFYLFAFSYCSWGSQGKNTEVVCYSILQWTTFCQNPLPIDKSQNLKNDRMISVRFQGRPFSITVIQVYAPASNAEEAKLNGSMKTYKNF